MKPERSFFLVTGGMFVAMVAIFFFFAYGKEHPVDTNRQRMEVLKTAIIDFSGENNRLPTTLTELDVPPENLTDHIGEPYVYTPDTLTVTLTSYGADKKPGGWMFTRDYTEKFANPLQP